MSQNRSEEVEQENVRIELLCLRLRAYALHVGTGLHNPPVTEEQVCQAEERLGFRLPELLRHLYTTVANGADFFMPGESFLGIMDKHNPGSVHDVTIETFCGSGEPLDEATVAALQAHPGAYVSCAQVPQSFVKVVALGDTVSLWLDGPSGRLFASDNVREPTGEERIGFSFWAPSVIEWLEHALIGPLFSYGAGRQPRVVLTHLATATDVPETSSVAPGIQTEAVQSHSLSSSEAVMPEQTTPYAHAHAQNVQQRLERAATRLRLERQAQRLALIREEVVRLLGEVADVQHNVLEEVKAANLAERGWGDVGLQYFAKWADKMEWGKAALQALADTEAQLFNMEWNIPWVD